MADIRAGQSFSTLHRTEERVRLNTVNLEDWLRLLVNETRRLRMGDTTAGDADVLSSTARDAS